MMERKARRSGLVMGFDNHIIAGSRACSYIHPGLLTRPLPTRQARTMPRPWPRGRLVLSIFIRQGLKAMSQLP
jgi:hypothetical protein